MKSKLMAIICAALMFCSGCQLALEDMGTDMNGDKLVGLFITTQSLNLFDTERYLTENINRLGKGDFIIDTNDSRYQGRLYAELTTIPLKNELTGEEYEMVDYIFPDIKGIPFFAAVIPDPESGEGYTTSVSSPEISDGHITVRVGDNEGIDLKGTIFAIQGLEEVTYFQNPVYQSADGRVYALSGSGYSAIGTEREGEVYSTTITSETTTTENGETKTYSAAVKLSISTVFAPEKIVIIEMSENSEPIKRTEYIPDEIPKVITPTSNTAYFIVETYKPKSAAKITREIFGRDAISIETFARNGTICNKQRTQINWPQL